MYFTDDERLRQNKKSRRNEKPCFLCDEPTYDWDYMCHDCRKDWYRGGKKREDDARLIGRDKIEQVPILGYWSFIFGWTKDKREAFDRSKINSRIRDAVIKLAGGERDEFDHYFSKARTLGMLKTHIGSPDNTSRSGEQSTVYKFPRRGTWKLLQDLTYAIRDLVNHHYNKGFQDGSNLLGRIARGEITVNEINERVRGKQK